MFEVLDKQEQEMKVAFLRMSNDTNGIQCEYFDEKPELLCDRYLGLNSIELLDKGLAGVALAEYDAGCWRLSLMTAVNDSAKQSIRDYVKYQLNR